MKTNKQQNKKIENKIKMNEARTAYLETTENIKELLKRLSYAVEEISYSDCAEGVNWTHVGSIKHCRQLLMETLMAMSLPDGMREEDFMNYLENEFKTSRKE